MPRARVILTASFAFLALAFPTQAQANIFGDLWDGVKDAVGELLDSGEGALEVQWEGVYGAGCGIKNLATWDGNSCTTSVSDAGDKTRNLMRDVDECAASFDPTGIYGLGAGNTVSDPDKPKGMPPSEVERVLSTATTEGAAASSAVNAYLKSAGGIAAIAKNPVWATVDATLPGVQYMLIAVSIAENCAATFDFLDIGMPFLLGTHGTQWRIRDGQWYECEITCKLSATLNYPGCEVIMVGGDNDPIEAVCAPGTGYREPEAPTDPLRTLICVPSMDRTGTTVASCDERMARAEQECRNGTSSLQSFQCQQLIRQTTPTTVETTTPTASGAAPNPNGLDAQGVPGGSVGGSCATIIRQVAAGAAGAPASATTIANCLGTADSTCQPIRAKAAAGYNVFPLPSDLQARCFG